MNPMKKIMTVLFPFLALVIALMWAVPARASDPNTQNVKVNMAYNTLRILCVQKKFTSAELLLLPTKLQPFGIPWSDTTFQRDLAIKVSALVAEREAAKDPQLVDLLAFVQHSPYGLGLSQLEPGAQLNDHFATHGTNFKTEIVALAQEMTRKLVPQTAPVPAAVPAGATVESSPRIVVTPDEPPLPTQPSAPDAPPTPAPAIQPFPIPGHPSMGTLRPHSVGGAARPTDKLPTLPPVAPTMKLEPPTGGGTKLALAGATPTARPTTDEVRVHVPGQPERGAADQIKNWAEHLRQGQGIPIGPINGAYKLPIEGAKLEIVTVATFKLRFPPETTFDLDPSVTFFLIGSDNPQKANKGLRERDIVNSTAIQNRFDFPAGFPEFTITYVGDNSFFLQGVAPQVETP